MKLIFLLTLTLLCLGLLAQAQVPSYVPRNGLVGWWPFNGNANDESGNGNHGTVNGATLAADRFGNAGKAYSLVVGDKISTNITPSNITQYSFSAWFKTTNGGAIIGSNALGNTKNLTLAIHTNSTSVGNLGTAIWVVDKTGYSVGWMSFPPANQLFNDNNWHHILGTFNCSTGNTISSSNLTLYVDGTLITTIAQNVGSETSPLNTLSNIVFGNNQRWINEGFDGRYSGLLDDIAIYNRALTASEVQQLYLGNSGNSASVTTVPGKINYQGVAVGANGKPIKNGSVGLRLSVLDSTLNGAVFYSETKTVTTDTSGLFATHVGGGTVTAGTFATIPWANGNDKFLKVEMDAQGGSNYQNMGTTQLVSVPYALHAGTAQSANSLRDSSGNAYQIKTVNGQPTLVPAPGSGSASNPGSFACGQAVNYAGESYPTVQIGNQCWFQKNLNVGTMVNGIIEQNHNGIFEKYCYNDDTANCDIYGGLYQWAEALQFQFGKNNNSTPIPNYLGKIQGVCLDGWHVPSDGEWCTLTKFLDSTVDCNANGGNGTDAGGKLKSTSILWSSPNNGATNSSGFSAIPGGVRNPNGSFNSLSSFSGFWSSTDSSSTSAAAIFLNNVISTNDRSNANKYFGVSVRCLKD